MTVTCLQSNTTNDLRCPVCGQGFLVFAERSNAAGREQMRRRVQHAMRSHHAGSPGALGVHPTEAFPVEGASEMAEDLVAVWVPVESRMAALAQ